MSEQATHDERLRTRGVRVFPSERMGDATNKYCAEYGGLLPAEESERWRYFSDGQGELVLFCPECPEREFGVDNSAR